MVSSTTKGSCSRERRASCRRYPFEAQVVHENVALVEVVVVAADEDVF